MLTKGPVICAAFLWMAAALTGCSAASPAATSAPAAGSAPAAEVCWVVGRVGAIFLTTNAKDWKRIHPPLMADFTAVTAQDASSAIVTATDGRRFATTDGGSHWNPAP